ncbi:MAG: hypothetical protein P9M11_11510 [Candidatus Tenebribacter burtonii]|nr:hypothetical protein [Candidatus Tenebribacter burtonii]
MNTLYFIPFMLIIGFSLLYIGLKIIIGKKPIVINSKWLFILIIIMYIPLLIIPTIIDFLNSEIVYFETSLVFILFTVIVVYMRRILNGYQLIGINGDTFGECLSHSLDNLNIEYEEKLNKIIITDSNLTILCSMQSWVGQAQIQFKGNKDKKFINSLIKEIKKYIRTNEIVSMKMPGFFYAIIGVVAIVMSVYELLKI